MNRTIRARLRNILAHLYAEEASIRRVCDDAGIDLARVVFNSSALNNWHAILTEAHRGNLVSALLDVVVGEYSTNEDLRAAFTAYRRAIEAPTPANNPIPANPVSNEAQVITQTSYRHDIFISYSHSDRTWVWDVLLPRLERAGLRVCIDNRDFKVGVPVLKNIEEAVENSRHTLIVLTPAWIESQWTEFESLLVATTDPASRNAQLLPLMLERCQLPLRIRALTYSDFTQEDQHDRQFEWLVQQIRVAPSIISDDSEEPASFVVGPPITNPRHFFGYQRELEGIFNVLRRQPLQNVAIIGPLRSGKTSLLLHLRDIASLPASEARPGQQTGWLFRPERYRWIFVDFQDRRMSTQEGFFRYLLTRLELPLPDPCDAEHFNEVIENHLDSRTVILLDEIGVALQSYQEFNQAFWQNLRAVMTTQASGKLAFVLAAPETPAKLANDNNKSSPFFNIFGYTVTLAPITEASARELIASSPLPFPEDDVVWILTQSARWPILLQALCRERLLALENGETNDAWREKGLRQMEPFLHLLELR